MLELQSGGPGSIPIRGGVIFCNIYRMAICNSAIHKATGSLVTGHRSYWNAILFLMQKLKMRTWSIHCEPNRSFPKLKLGRIELIELIEQIWITLGIVKINSNYQPSRKSCLVIIELVVDKLILYIVNKHQCNMFTMCSFFINFLLFYC